MRKLTEEQRQAIILSHTLDNSNENIRRICQDYGITKKTIYNVIEKEKKEKNGITPFRPNYTKTFQEIIDKAVIKLKNQLENEDIKAKDITTMIAILYDKIRLEEGLSTENKAININIKVEK